MGSPAETNLDSLPRVTWKQAMSSGLDTYKRLVHDGLQPVRPPVALTEFERRPVKLFSRAETVSLREVTGRAIDWATAVLVSDAVILDTETTGVDTSTDRVVQIAVIDMSGRQLLDTLIDPGVPIPERATTIHGISDQAVACQPTFAQALPEISDVLGDRDVVVYNSVYDGALLRAEVARVHGDEHAEQWTRSRTWKCAMRVYSWYKAQWSVTREDWIRHKLPGALHGAMGDCQATLELIRTMAAAGEPPEGYGAPVTDSRGNPHGWPTPVE
ncbi:3'-5' exonuclease [Streptosporangium sp. CA-115845]|uniref:3'-5' exonuclease n=1 Tax=Streptosporangium sp. CA-115845 TaxID=3240071 RepID=UPI003D8CCB34